MSCTANLELNQCVPNLQIGKRERKDFMNALTMLTCLIVLITIALLIARSISQIQKHEWLRQYGTRVNGRVTDIRWGVDQNRIGEYIPLKNQYYVICAEWQHPQTHQLIHFIANVSWKYQQNISQAVP